MAEDKKSFILYCDQIHSFENLDDDEAGRLIKHIFRYVNDMNPEITDKITKIAFEPIKHQLKRDLVKWDSFRQKQSLNGSKGGRPKKDLDNLANKENPKNPSLILESQKSLNVNVNDNVTVNESVCNSNSTPTQILGFNYRPQYENTSDEFQKMYDKKFYDSWLSINAFLDENCKYLRNWENQITIAEHKKIYDRVMKNDFTIEQAKTALQELDGSRIAKDRYNSVYHGFNTFIKTIIKNAYV